MSEPTDENAVLSILFAMTAVTGIVDAVSFLRWQRRCASIVAMLGGAAAGALMVRYSLALPLFVCAAVSAIAAMLRFFWR